MDRATRLLQEWSKAYDMFLAMGMPKEEIDAGLAGALNIIAETDPEFYEEIVITARFEKLLYGEDER